METSAIIFDLDGTLADTMPAHFASWQIICNRYGLSFPEGRFYALGGWPTRRIVELLASEQGVSLDAEAISMEKEQTFLEMVHKVQPIEVVAAVATANHGLLPMAVATGSRRRQADLVLKQIGLGHLFDAVVCAEDCPTHKPEPDIYLIAARALGVAPGQCLVYEDTDPGVEGASRAGMACIDVRSLRSPGEISSAAFGIRKVEEQQE